MAASAYDSIDLTGDSDEENVDLPDLIGVEVETNGAEDGNANGFAGNGHGGDGPDMEVDGAVEGLPTLDDFQGGDKNGNGDVAAPPENLPGIAPDEDFEITGSTGPGPSASTNSWASTQWPTSQGIPGQSIIQQLGLAPGGPGNGAGGPGGIAAPAAPGPGGYSMFRPNMANGAQARVHPPPLFAHYPSPMYAGPSNGLMTPSPHHQSSFNLPSAHGGSSASDAIDITNMRIPSPPPDDPKQTICIGAITGHVVMLEHPECVFVGGQPPEKGKEKYSVIEYRQAEFLKVKLKWRTPGKEKEGEPWTRVATDTIQVMTSYQTEYIGDLDQRTSDCIMDLITKGLVRLEGYQQRIQPGSTQQISHINVLVFTLVANRDYVSKALVRSGVFLSTPQPPYDPTRHSDRPPLRVPEYQQPVHNPQAWMGSQQFGMPAMPAHWGPMQMAQFMQARGQGRMGMPGMPPGYMYQLQQNRIKTEDLERQVKDDVFKALEAGIELDQTDPGVLIKTTLFPHQRKALTFMLLREQDLPAFKEAKKQHEKYLKRVAKKQEKAQNKIQERIKAKGGASGATPERIEIEVSSKDVSPVKEEIPALEVKSDEVKAEVTEPQHANGSQTVDDDVEITDGTDFKKTQRDKSFDSSSLWEPTNDTNGKPRKWKNKLTGEVRRTKTKPAEGKSAILADDMGLGKTLSIISLIAATRESASKWAKAKTATDEMDAKLKTELDATGFKGRVFGMPDVEDTDSSTAPGKKRKREETEKHLDNSRQSRIKARSKGTLLISPMSTINNWREQLKAHWNGPVELVGGEKGIPPKEFTIKRRQHRKGISDDEDDETDDFDILRVYVYHGPSRVPDPKYLAQFDLVITSYNVLALEYSKMCVNLTADESTPASSEPSPAETPVEGDAPDIMDNGMPGSGVDVAVEAEIREQEFAEKLRRDLKKKGKASQPKKAEMSPLQAVDWFRVVLDEAHYIKTPSTVASKAACYLSCDRRIALSGTPIQNKIEDIWALFKFLRLDPVDQKDTFNNLISAPCKVGSSVGVARLQLVMRACTLRRTKDSKDETGKKVLELPKRHDQVVKLTLSEEERAAYDEAREVGAEKLGEYKEAQAMAQDKSAKAAGTGTSYRNVLQHLLRLRQICDHVELAAAGESEEDYDGTLMDYSVAVKGIERDGLNLARAQSVFANRKATDAEELECNSCQANFSKSFPAMYPDGDMEPLADLAKLTIKPFLTKCLHVFCPPCFKSSIYPAYRPRMKEIASRPCSVCNVTLKVPTDVIEVSAPTTEGQQDEEPAKKGYQRKRYIRPAGQDIKLSSKMFFLLNDLLRFSRRNPHSENYAPLMLDAGVEVPEDEMETYDERGNIRPTKSIIFSQWTSMLDRVGDMLDTANIKYDRLDGTMSLMDRGRAMAALADPKKGVEVLLVSLRAGGVGLNLTSANRVYVMEPYWNPAVEAQAIDRIHRMGQTRPVTSIRLIMEDSVEIHIQKMQERKAQLAEMGLNKMSKAEIMARRAEDLADIFGETKMRNFRE